MMTTTLTSFALFGRMLHAVKNGSDKVIQSPNIQSLINKTNENKLTALLTSTIDFLPDDLAIYCTSIIPEYEAQNGRITQKVDTIIAKFPDSPLLKLMSRNERSALLQRANQHYQLTTRLLKFQTENNVNIHDYEELPIPNISLEG